MMIHPYLLILVWVGIVAITIAFAAKRAAWLIVTILVLLPAILVWREIAAEAAKLAAKGRIYPMGDAVSFYVILQSMALSIAFIIGRTLRSYRLKLWSKVP